LIDLYYIGNGNLDDNNANVKPSIYQPTPFFKRNILWISKKLK